jgi:hypothetical protein
MKNVMSTSRVFLKSCLFDNLFLMKNDPVGGVVVVVVLVTNLIFQH